MRSPETACAACRIFSSAGGSRSITPYRASFARSPRRSTAAEDLSRVRVVKLGGEAVLASDFELYRNRFSRRCVFQVGYGATEINVIRQWSAGPDAPWPGGIPLGYPVDETEVVLLDAEGRETEGEGEIGIRARTLAVGYWKDPELTASAFRPVAGRPGFRLYRTGDLGRFLPDGCLLHTGRRDARVKVRGHRVEVAEVESALAAIPGVREAAAGARQTPGGTKLAAWVVIDRESRRTASDLRRALAAKLPAALVPTAFVFLEALPRAASGKLDRGGASRARGSAAADRDAVSRAGGSGGGRRLRGLPRRPEPRPGRGGRRLLRSRRRLAFRSRRAGGAVGLAGRRGLGRRPSRGADAGVSRGAPARPRAGSGKRLRPPPGRRPSGGLRRAGGRRRSRGPLRGSEDRRGDGSGVPVPVLPLGSSSASASAGARPELRRAAARGGASRPVRARGRLRRRHRRLRDGATPALRGGGGGPARPAGHALSERGAQAPGVGAAPRAAGGAGDRATRILPRARRASPRRPPGAAAGPGRLRPAARTGRREGVRSGRERGAPAVLWSSGRPTSARRCRGRRSRTTEESCSS